MNLSVVLEKQPQRYLQLLNQFWSTRLVHLSHIIFKALVAIGLWGMFASGYWRAPMGMVERVMALVAAAMLVVALPITDEIGLALAAAFMGQHMWRHRVRHAT